MPIYRHQNQKAKTILYFNETKDDDVAMVSSGPGAYK